MIGDSYCLEFCSMMQREVNTPLFHSSLNSLCAALPSNIGSVSDFTQSSRVRLPVLLQICRSNNFLVPCAGVLLNVTGYVVPPIMVFRLAFFQQLTTFIAWHCSVT